MTLKLLGVGTALSLARIFESHKLQHIFRPYAMKVVLVVLVLVCYYSLGVHALSSNCTLTEEVERVLLPSAFSWTIGPIADSDCHDNNTSFQVRLLTDGGDAPYLVRYAWL